MMRARESGAEREEVQTRAGGTIERTAVQPAALVWWCAFYEVLRTPYEYDIHRSMNIELPFWF